MASDSRSNAGFDQVNVCRKMYRFVTEGRAGLRHPHERQPVDQPVGHLAAARRFRRRSRARAGALDLSRRPHRRRNGAEGLRDRSRLARARQFQLQRQPAARRPGPRRAADALSHLSAGQSAAGDRRLSVSAARRSEVRPADPRSRHPERHVAGSGGQIRAAVVRRDHALERDRRPAHRPAVVQARQLADYALPAARRLRSGSQPDSRVLGAVAPAGGRAAAGDRVRGPAGPGESDRDRRRIARDGAAGEASLSRRSSVRRRGRLRSGSTVA